MKRQVRGSLFVDYVRMLRSRKDIDWSRWLLPADVPYLAGKIDLTAWYPMETFERMGVAILSETAQDQIPLVEIFGRASVDGLLAQYPMLLAKGEPRETLMRFQALQRGFFDFPAFEFGDVTDHHTQLRIDYQMGARAEEAACHQALGFFDRLLELAGADARSVDLVSCRWAGDATTVLTMRY